MKHLFRCSRCRYHYGPRQLVIYPGTLYPVCADRAACDARIAQRERDREALRPLPRSLET